jgi:hypothetical protein
MYLWTTFILNKDLSGNDGSNFSIFCAKKPHRLTHLYLTLFKSCPQLTAGK